MASRKKHLAIPRGKRPWRNGGRGEHILNRFPSSVRDIFMCPATGCQDHRVYTGAGWCIAATRSLLFEDSPLFFFGGFEFKRFKAISQGVARRIVGPRMLIDRRRLPLFFRRPSCSRPSPFIPFNLSRTSTFVPHFVPIARKMVVR